MSPYATGLDEADCDPSPFVQFARWFEESRDLLTEPEAVALATADESGRPSVRMVLLKSHDERGFVFYSHYHSRKGRDLAARPYAALLSYVEDLGRQVRVEGEVHPLGGAQSDEYFASRSRMSQLGAQASPQSEEIASRAVLEDLVAAVDRRFPQDVPRPEGWGGYRLVPDRFEFWQRRDGRLHDRVVYLAQGDGWRRARLAP